jgi:hypothetical protein
MRRAVVRACEEKQLAHVFLRHAREPSRSNIGRHHMFGYFSTATYSIQPCVLWCTTPSPIIITHSQTNNFWQKQETAEFDKNVK